MFSCVYLWFVVSPLGDPIELVQEADIKSLESNHFPTENYVLLSFKLYLTCILTN